MPDRMPAQDADRPPGVQARTSVSVAEPNADARGPRPVRYRHAGADPRRGGGGQDRDDHQLRRCLVRRLDPAAHGGRLGGLPERQHVDVHLYNGGPVEGGTFPAIIWHDFMVDALGILATERPAPQHVTVDPVPARAAGVAAPTPFQGAVAARPPPAPQAAEAGIAAAGIPAGQPGHRWRRRRQRRGRQQRHNHPCRRRRQLTNDHAFRRWRRWWRRRRRQFRDQYARRRWGRRWWRRRWRRRPRGRRLRRRWRGQLRRRRHRPLTSERHALLNPPGEPAETESGFRTHRTATAGQLPW